MVYSSTKEPVIIFCNAFERDQTIYLLNWLVSKGNTNSQQSSKPLFRVCSFEALVVAILRRLGTGDYAHQSVREQLRRPVYTLQVKERCVYHDSLAIQHCCRAINHGFSLFLDGFVRQRFIQALPAYIHDGASGEHLSKILPAINLTYQAKSVCSDSTRSGLDSISTTYIEKRKGLRLLTQQRKIEEEPKVKE